MERPGIGFVIQLCLVGLLAGCGDNLAPAGDREDAGGTSADARLPPEEVTLSHEPAWTARGSAEETCFGDSAEVADLDGDGRPELLVGIPRCFTPRDDSLAVYRGEVELFAPEDAGMRVTVDWQNENPFPFNFQLAIAAGDVDGDERADVLLSSRNGAVLYRGNPVLGAVFEEPAFRVPGESFGSAVLADLDGDGRDDIVATVAGDTVVFLNGGGDVPAFTQARVIPDARVGGAGDVNGDGAIDLFAAGPDSTQLYLGCGGQLPACDGGLSGEPAWTTPLSATVTIVDVNADGRGDAVVRDFGRIFLHLTDPATGLPADQATWSQIGDPVFLTYGGSVTAAGGVMGDGPELLVGASARVYLYAVPEGPFDSLDPVWAFPEEDAFTAAWPIDFNYDVAAAGDVNGDSHADFVVAGTSTESGMAMVFTGGKLPDGASSPHIPEARECGPLTGGVADLTVDTDVMERSLLITTDSFDAASCEVLEGCVSGTGERKLLRFSVSIANLGSGGAVVPGPEEAPELYQFDECHQHDHLIDFSNYRMVGRDGTEVLGHKQGYFLVDMAPYCAESAASVDTFPSMGISAGWSDVYIANYDCQWIDITGVPDGTYDLRVSVDDADLIAEGDEHPNEVSVTVQIAGDQVSVPGRARSDGMAASR
ncbi:MAG TPA: lysyl oxidase family protein [Kofleriaceae bacterium]|nr:lysyl oxidase family protein [Kofleriaceae bacterium]